MDLLAHFVVSLMIHTTGYTICNSVTNGQKEVQCQFVAASATAATGLTKEFILDDKPDRTDLLGDALGLSAGILITW